MKQILKPMKSKRLQLREIQEKDLLNVFALLKDEDVTKFLPMFPLKSIQDAQEHMKKMQANAGRYVAICDGNDEFLGYLHVGEADAYDFGYALRKEYWHQGIVSEAAQMFIEHLKTTGIPYLTATHDVHNPNSGKVMQKIGMQYAYSYQEQWQPKNLTVIFRMYQLNFDEHVDTYAAYWNKYPHFIEDGVQ